MAWPYIQSAGDISKNKEREGVPDENSKKTESSKFFGFSLVTYKIKSCFEIEFLQSIGFLKIYEILLNTPLLWRFFRLKIMIYIVNYTQFDDLNSIFLEACQKCLSASICISP